MPTTPCSPPDAISGSERRNDYAAPLRLRIDPSPWLRRVYLSFHLLAALAPFLTPLPWWAALLCLPPLALRARYHWLRQPALHVGTSLLWDAAGEWSLSDEEGRWRLHGEALVIPSLLILRLRGEGKGRELLIPADAVAAEPFRRLRVRLALEAD